MSELSQKKAPIYEALERFRRMRDVYKRQEVSIISMIGFVMLCGIIVNNGIVLVDYINQLRAAGMEKRQAIVTAGKTRMRPIMMTALTTILGLATMAVGFGMGADMTQPMAVVVIGGLLYGTLLLSLIHISPLRVRLTFKSSF